MRGLSRILRLEKKVLSVLLDDFYLGLGYTLTVPAGTQVRRGQGNTYAVTKRLGTWSSSCGVDVRVRSRWVLGCVGECTVSAVCVPSGCLLSDVEGVCWKRTSGARQ